MAINRQQQQILDRAASTMRNSANAFGRTSMTSPAASRLPTSDFSSIQPRQQPTLPFAGGGTATMGLGGANVNYPYSRGMMAGSPESFASRLPQAPAAPSNLFSRNPIAAASEQFRPTTGGMLNRAYSNPFASPSERMGPTLTQGLTPTSPRPSFDLGGRPLDMRGSTAMTSPQMAEPQGRTPISVRGGTIYATPEQKVAFESRASAFEGRTPERQQELLAQMREAGGRIGESIRNERTRDYYQFVQGLEEEKALRAAGQVAAEQARGGSGRDASRRMEQAQVRAELAKQAGQLVGRTDQRAPFFSWEPVTRPNGEQFYRGRMGEYFRVPQRSPAGTSTTQASNRETTNVPFTLTTPLPSLSGSSSAFGGNSSFSNLDQLSPFSNFRS